MSKRLPSFFSVTIMMYGHHVTVTRFCMHLFKYLPYKLVAWGSTAKLSVIFGCIAKHNLRVNRRNLSYHGIPGSPERCSRVIISVGEWTNSWACLVYLLIHPNTMRVGWLCLSVCSMQTLVNMTITMGPGTVMCCVYLSISGSSTWWSETSCILLHVLCRL
jgi:hypothetical protein